MTDTIKINCKREDTAIERAEKIVDIAFKDFVRNEITVSKMESAYYDVARVLEGYMKLDAAMEKSE